MSKEEIEEISNLVIIDLKRLISAMQVIMELEKNDTRISGEEQQMLQETGKVSFDCLERLWSLCGQSILKSGIVDAHQLCLILQAYCLIHPSEYLDKTHQVQPPSNTNLNYYLVPSLLPEAKSLTEKEEGSVLPWVSFYFDFEGFLPLEIYHRLICLLLAAYREGNRRPNATHCLSKTLCRFDGIRGCNWKVELEKHQQRLKVSVM